VLEVDLVVIAIESPLKIGIYRDGTISHSLEFTGQTSEVLPVEFKKLTKEYKIRTILFANGPGSFMAIKVNYIFLKTLATVLDIELFGVDAFFFNSNRPIKAVGGNCFVKRDGKIEIERVEEFVKSEYRLPETFDPALYSKDVEPLYILPAV
jgi:tRNA threonylcarbamoyladenosine biosynthesis protein TsaB